MATKNSNPMNGDCIHSMCQHNREGACLDPALKDPYKQTGCLLYVGVNFTDYPKDDRCKFCIDRWDCHYKDNGICQRKGEGEK